MSFCSFSLFYFFFPHSKKRREPFSAHAAASFVTETKDRNTLFAICSNGYRLHAIRKQQDRTVGKPFLFLHIRLSHIFDPFMTRLPFLCLHSKAGNPRKCKIILPVPPFRRPSDGAKALLLLYCMKFVISTKQCHEERGFQNAIPRL